MVLIQRLSNREKVELAEVNQGLIISVANSFRSTGVPHEELICIAGEGFSKALVFYDKGNKYNTQFSTFAFRVMHNEIKGYLRKEKKHKENLSPNGDIVSENENGDLLTLENMSSSIDKEEFVLDEVVEEREKHRNLEKAILTLSKEEQEIICLRYGVLGKSIHTQEQVGEKLGISQASISKKEKAIKEKLKRKLITKIDITDYNMDFGEDLSEEDKLFLLEESDYSL